MAFCLQKIKFMFYTVGLFPCLVIPFPANCSLQGTHKKNSIINVTNDAHGGPPFRWVTCWVGPESGTGVCRFRWRCPAALYENQIDLLYCAALIWLMCLIKNYTRRRRKRKVKNWQCRALLPCSPLPWVMRVRNTVILAAYRNLAFH